MTNSKKRVGIIGAGAAGLITALKLLKTDRFQVTLYEIKDQVGGTWNFVSEFKTKDIDTTISSEWATVLYEPEEIKSAIYPSLRTNLPLKLMEFREYSSADDVEPFPLHFQILKYLNEFATKFNLHQYIKFKTIVTNAQKNGSSWHLHLKDSESGITLCEQVDILIVCSGLFTYPKIPNLRNLKSFPRELVHSQSYRQPEKYTDKTLMIVGCSYSGQDVLRECSLVAKKIYLSVHDPSSTTIQNTTNLNVVAIVGEIKEFQSNGSILLLDGSVIDDVQVVIFATGYIYHFPFFQDEFQKILTDGLQVNDLYLHLFYSSDPSLAFVGLPRNVVPFHLFEYQAEMLSAVYTDTVKLPDIKKMRRIEEELGGYGGEPGGKGVIKHKFGPAREFVYCNALADMYGGKKVDQYRIELRTNLGPYRLQSLGY
jgi:cation diffusion facilitator CzcD-associated flavoprotein CzcO